MERDKRNALVQDYVDIRVFLMSVQQMKNRRALEDEVLDKKTDDVKD